MKINILHYVFVFSSLLSVFCSVNDSAIRQMIDTLRLNSFKKNLCLELLLKIIAYDNVKLFWAYEMTFNRDMGVSYVEFPGRSSKNKILIKWMIYCQSKRILRSMVQKNNTPIMIDRLEDAQMLVEKFNFSEIIDFFSNEKMPFILNKKARKNLQTAILDKYSDEMNEVDRMYAKLLGAQANISRYLPIYEARDNLVKVLEIIAGLVQNPKSSESETELRVLKNFVFDHIEQIIELENVKDVIQLFLLIKKFPENNVFISKTRNNIKIPLRDIYDALNSYKSSMPDALLLYLQLLITNPQIPHLYGIYESGTNSVEVLQVISRIIGYRNDISGAGKLHLKNFIAKNLNFISNLVNIDDVFCIASLVIELDDLLLLQKIIKIQPDVVIYTTASYYGYFNLHNMAASHSSIECIRYLFHNYPEQVFSERGSRTAVESLIISDPIRESDGDHLFLEFGFDPYRKVRGGLNNEIMNLIELCEIRHKTSLAEALKNSINSQTEDLTI